MNCTIFVYHRLLFEDALCAKYYPKRGRQPWIIWGDNCVHCRVITFAQTMNNDWLEMTRVLNYATQLSSLAFMFHY